VSFNIGMVWLVRFLGSSVTASNNERKRYAHIYYRLLGHVQVLRQSLSLVETPLI